MRRALFVLWLIAGCSDRATPGLDQGSAARDSALRGDAALACNAIASEYPAQLELARVCNPVLSTLQCTRLIYRALPCPGCGNFVNPSNTAALARLDDLQQSWKAQRCGEGIMCPAIDCADPRSGSCEPTPPNSKVPGLCKNNY